MSFRYYRRFVYGNPQRRVFLPNFWMKLVPNEVEKPANCVQFIVPLEMTERDVKNYLEKIYKVPVVDVQVKPRDAKIKKGIKGYLVKEGDDYKSAFVQLPKDMKFEYPDLFPQEKMKEEDENFEQVFNKGAEIEKEMERLRAFKKDIPPWY